ncbi:heat-inducible transcription repressor [Streptococcus pneumoniae]|nr:heat-inducible transcription repressor [Streptococcus pneumoniae]
MAGKVHLLNFANLAAYQFICQVQLRLFRSCFFSCFHNFLFLNFFYFLIPYRGVGILAIIGPVNLDYQQLINQVNVVNRVLTMKLTDFYRYLSSNHYEVH